MTNFFDGILLFQENNVVDRHDPKSRQQSQGVTKSTHVPCILPSPTPGFERPVPPALASAVAIANAEISVTISFLLSGSLCTFFSKVDRRSWRRLSAMPPLSLCPSEEVKPRRVRQACKVGETR